MSQQKAYKTCEQFVLSVYKTFETQPLKLQIFINMFHHNKKQNNKQKESQSKLAELIQDYPDLVDQLNKILPDGYKVAKSNIALSAQQEEDEEPMDINKIFAELQARRPAKVQHIIELIQGIKNNKNKKNNEGLRDKLAKILEDEPNLFSMFMRYLRPFLEETATNNGHLEPEPSREESLSGEGGMELEDADDLILEPRTRGTRGGRRRGGRGGQGRRAIIRKPEGENGSPTVTPTVTLPVTVRNELNLFENLRTSLNKSNYNQLMKVIYLYTECVIGANEVHTMVKPLFKGNDNYANLFQEMIFAREKTRRKNTTLFKPLSDIDFASKKISFLIG